MDRARPIAERLVARYPLLYLISGDEPDARTLLRRCGKTAGLTLAEPRYGRAELVTAAADALDSLVEMPERTLLVLAGGHRLLAEATFVQILTEQLRAIEKLGHTVVLLAAHDVASADLDRDRVVLYLPLPGAEELRPLVEAAFTPSAKDAADPKLVERALEAAKGMTTVQLRRALRRLRAGGGVPGLEAVAGLHAEKRDLVAHGGVLDVVADPPLLADVGGMDNLKEWLSRRRRALSTQAREFGLPAPRGVLLLGVQGCGKSLMAKVVSRHWGLPLLRLDIGALFAGRRAPELAMRQALAIAEAISPAVLWVDEIEKAFDRDASSGTHRLLGGLLTWMQEKSAPVFFVATANRVDNLPPELLRKGRFDEIFFVDLPDTASRQEILSIHLTARDRNPRHYDLLELAAAAHNFSGAELEQVVVSGLYLAFGRGEAMSQEDLLNAATQTVPLARTCEEEIKELRVWARDRARFATRDATEMSYFGGLLKEPRKS